MCMDGLLGCTPGVIGCCYATYLNFTCSGSQNIQGPPDPAYSDKLNSLTL